MNDKAILDRLPAAHAAARSTLLSLRNEHGHWEGELSSSALSTATAVCALRRYLEQGTGIDAERRESVAALADRGLQWLAENQNADGGWGDTTISFSNISTTALCWAALAGEEARFADADRAAAAWLTRAGGSLKPHVLAEAIRRRYGKDHTFSVPILTTLALHGRLGDPGQAWSLVPQLPFELAALPRQWFARLRMPVVSYALPALIAIGLVRHANRPTRNPAARRVRNLCRRRVLSVLGAIQPAGGGFLEATPLTSFVTMGLLGAGEADGPVVGEAVAFLDRSARPDGSWPIDTNLATWVTTLAVNALAAGEEQLELPDLSRTLRWLLDQQLAGVHPYTQAAPGGWAWTDLPGGVPDADDTPGALLALRALVAGCGEETEVASAAAAGVRWLVDLQNRDGGMPTFCRGWGTLPFDRSSCDITAHGLRGMAAWAPTLPAKLADAAHLSKARGLAFLAKQQRPDGAWAPLWFGNQHATREDETNLTYGTSRVLIALAELQAAGRSLCGVGGPSLARGVNYLLGDQHHDGGWGGAPDTPATIEETALAVEALSACWPHDSRPEVRSAVSCGAGWLIGRTDGGREFQPSPIGFYFAKLWYYEKLYPVVYTVAALGRALSVLDAGADIQRPGVGVNA